MFYYKKEKDFIEILIRWELDTEPILFQRKFTTTACRDNAKKTKAKKLSGKGKSGGKGGKAKSSRKVCKRSQKFSMKWELLI